MLPTILADVSFSSGLSDGLTAFSSVFTTVIGNPIMAGVIFLGLGVSAVSLVWGIFH